MFRSSWKFYQRWKFPLNRTPEPDQIATCVASTSGRLYSTGVVVSVSFRQIYTTGVIGHRSRVEMTWSRDADDDSRCRYVTHHWPWSVDMLLHRLSGRNVPGQPRGVKTRENFGPPIGCNSISSSADGFVSAKVYCRCLFADTIHSAQH